VSDVVVRQFTFAISSPDELLDIIYYPQQNAHNSNKLSKLAGNTRQTSDD